MPLYPVLPEYQGIPQEYQAGAQWVANPAYSGGGYYSYEGGEQYSYAQLERLWTDAGGSSKDAPNMAYIAKYDESGGNAGAWNSTGATGLWQIEWPSNYGGARQDLFTPLKQAQTAVGMFNRSGYSPWGSDVKQNLGVTPASSVPDENKAVPGGSAAGQSSAPIPATDTSATSFLGTTLQSFLGIPNFNWADLGQRLGLILLGAALIILGIYLLAGKQTLRIASAVKPI